jgi:hypothetical protein
MFPAAKIIPKNRSGMTCGGSQSRPGEPRNADDEATGFSINQTGNIAQQYLHRARMFREAAIQLPNYSNGELFWPKDALLTHVIE